MHSEIRDLETLLARYRVSGLITGVRGEPEQPGRRGRIPGQSEYLEAACDELRRKPCDSGPLSARVESAT